MSFNIRIDGADKIKIYLQKFMEAQDKMSENIYKELMEGTKLEFSMTLGCYALDSDAIIWAFNNARNGEVPDFTLPQKSFTKKLKKSLR